MPLNLSHNTRGVENDSLSAILGCLKEGDSVWRWSARALAPA